MLTRGPPGPNPKDLLDESSCFDATNRCKDDTSKNRMGSFTSGSPRLFIFRYLSELSKEVGNLSHGSDEISGLQVLTQDVFKR